MKTDDNPRWWLENSLKIFFFSQNPTETYCMQAYGSLHFSTEIKSKHCCVLICSITAGSVLILARAAVGICDRPDAVLAQIPLSADTCIGNQFCAGKLYTQHCTRASQCSHCDLCAEEVKLLLYWRIQFSKSLLWVGFLYKSTGQNNTVIYFGK